MRWWLGAMGLLVLGLVFQLGLLVYAMYVLVGVLLVSRFLAWHWMEGLTAVRHAARHSIRTGERAQFLVTVQNKGRLPIPWLIAEDSLPEGVSTGRTRPLRLVDGRRGAITDLRRGEELHLLYELEFRQRGYYQIGPVLLESGDLFGLHRRYRVMTEPDFVQVLPKIVALESYDIASQRPLGEVRWSHRLFEDPTRIHGVRPYQRGDSLRRIHWRATARMGALQSKTYEPSSIAGATLVLDFHKGDFGLENGTYYAELAITTVVSIGYAVSQLGQQIGLVTNGRDAAERVRTEGITHAFETRAAARKDLMRRPSGERWRPIVIPTRRGEEHFMRIWETGARLELSEELTFPQLLAASGGRIPHDATVIAVLPDVPVGTASALGNLRRQGFYVMAIVITSEAGQYQTWARPPEWAANLLAERIDFRQVGDETELASLCGEYQVTGLAQA